MFKIRITLSICISLFFLNLNANESNIKPASQFTIANGLPHNGVTSIFEDSRGYQWIGTYDGIARYDGYNFKVFKNLESEIILSSNRVRTITEDNNKNLLLGTDDGITVFDYSHQKFKTIYSNKLVKKGINGPIVLKINKNSNNGFLTCLTENGKLILIDSTYTVKSIVELKNRDSKKKTLYFDLEALDDTNYLISNTDGLCSYNTKTKQIIHPFKFKTSTSFNITLVSPNTILLPLSKGLGIIKFKKTGSYYHFDLQKTVLTQYSFNVAHIDALGQLWLGTTNHGVFLIDNYQALLNNKPYNISHYTNQNGLLRTSTIISSKNAVWVGTYNKGIHKFDIEKNPFNSYNASSFVKYGLSSSEILASSKYDANRILIVANQGGVSLFNTKTKQFEALPFNISENEAKRVAAIFVDKKKNIWIKLGSKSGIFRVKAGQKNIQNVSSTSLPNDIEINLIEEDKFGNIWLVADNKLYKLSFDSTNEIKKVELLNSNPVFSSNSSMIRKLYFDPIYNFLWIGTTSDGLFRVTINEKTPIEKSPISQYINNRNDYKSISNNFVVTVNRLSNKELWVGTEGAGICLVSNSNQTPEFIRYSEKDGLSNNVVKNIIQDNDSTVWIPTNIGLNRFNLISRKFTRFGGINGLPFEDFTYPAAKMDNGTLFFSGVDGFCYFNSKDLLQKEELPRFEFGEFRLFNKTVSPGDSVNNRILINKRLNDVGELNLKYNENVFSIELTSLHFSTPDNHYIRYKLSPINKEWIEIPTSQHFIYYSGLQPGTYHLKVMVSNSLNNWSEPQELIIKISPPFWKTYLAYFLYLILLGIVIYMIVRINLRFQLLKHNLQIEQLEKDNEKNISDAKLRFFSNISHEIKTPLTLITGPIELLSERFKGNADVRDKFNLVQRQLKKTSQLISQVLDYQKSEAYLLNLDNSYFCFNTFIENLILDFKFLADNDNKVIQTIAKNENIYVYADKDKLEKIFNNLLNNAFKYTNANDSITIEYEAKDNNLIISVTDTGKGIDKEDLPYIFDRFFQSLNKKNIYTGGSGIGLAFTKRLVEMHYGYISAQSEVDHGTSIHIQMPIISTELINNEIEEEILKVESKFIPETNLINKRDTGNIITDGEFKDVKIFFAEDNTEMRIYVSEILSQFFTVKSFINGLECVDALENEWPDIVLSDVLMPELNGFDLCRRIKTDVKTSHIPVMLLTACITINDKLEGVNVGADAYIEKPFNIQHLVSTIESLLRNRKQLRDRFKLEIPVSFDNQKDNQKDIAFLEKLYKLIEENISNDEIDMDDFAKSLYLNRTRFYNKVKALTNQSPYEILKMYRIKKAAELLTEGKYNVNEVYMMTGFKSRPHFSKLFKDVYNVSPGKYVENKTSEQAKESES